METFTDILKTPRSIMHLHDIDDLLRLMGFPQLVPL